MQLRPHMCGVGRVVKNVIKITLESLIVLNNLSVAHGIILLNQTKGQLMPIYEVTCIHYEICGSIATFDESEYDIYNDDYTCAECFDQLEMFSHGWRDIDSDNMMTRMADAEMGDL